MFDIFVLILFLSLQDVYSRITNFEARRNHDERRDDVDEQAKYAKMFMDYGGVEVITHVYAQIKYFKSENIFVNVL